MVSVSIPAFRAEKPVLYEVSVDLGPQIKPYTVLKRFSEFLKLAKDVEAEMGEPVTVPPPRKPGLWESIDYNKRRIDLEVMLTALVRVPEFAQSLALSTFLDVYKHKAADRAQTPTVDWVHATSEVSRLIGDARSQSQPLQIRQRTLQAMALVGQLQSSLATAKLGQGEKNRRQQQLDNFLVAVRQLEVRLLAGGQLRAQEGFGDWELGGGAQDDAPRVLGETSETRKLNNSGLLQHQQLEMENQDKLVEGLRATVTRQKELGLAIHAEVSKQNELLDELDTNVHRVSARLNEACRKTEQLK